MVHRFVTGWGYPAKLFLPSTTMNRDALLATLIGFGVGLLIMGGILVGPKLSIRIPKITIPKIAITLPTRTPKVTPGTQSPTEKAAFSIDKPVNDSVLSESEIPITGSARDATLVVVQGPGGETVSSPESDGTYAATIALVEGRNDIIVTAYHETEVQELTVTVYYTPETL